MRLFSQTEELNADSVANTSDSFDTRWVTEMETQREVHVRQLVIRLRKKNNSHEISVCGECFDCATHTLRTDQFCWRFRFVFTINSASFSVSLGLSAFRFESPKQFRIYSIFCVWKFMFAIAAISCITLQYHTCRFHSPQTSCIQSLHTELCY